MSRWSRSPIALLVALLVTGCGNQASRPGTSGNQEDESGVAACDAYLGALQACVRAGTTTAEGRPSGSLANQRASLRESLERAERRGPDAGAEERARLESACRRMSARLAESCR